jgi:hypothetical protein
VGPRAGLDTEARGKILSPLPGIEPRLPGRPTRSHRLLTELPGSHHCHILSENQYLCPVPRIKQDRVTICQVSLSICNLWTKKETSPTRKNFATEENNMRTGTALYHLHFRVSRLPTRLV